MNKVFLVGVDHVVQWNQQHHHTFKFRQRLQWMCENNEIDVIAEEFSREACALNDVSTSTAEDVANQMGLSHKYCDPDSATRKTLGIPEREEIKIKRGFNKRQLTSREISQIEVEMRKYDPIREQYWLDQIANLTGKIIFACGSTHICSFSRLLEIHGYEFDCKLLAPGARV